MNNKKIIALIILALFALALIPKAYSQSTQIKTFYYYSEANLTIEVKGEEETEPGKNITITISINSSADNLRVKYLYLTIYDFQGGKNKKVIANLTHVSPPGIELNYNQNHTQSYQVSVSEDAWDVMYGEISCHWIIEGTVPDPHTIPSYGFVMTYVRNVEMEKLQHDFAELQQNYTQLEQNYTLLNQSYWTLKVNGTGLETELSNTRLAMVILVITTVFFVATTLYLMVKKPKEYW